MKAEGTLVLAAVGSVLFAEDLSSTYFRPRSLALLPRQDLKRAQGWKDRNLSITQSEV